MVNKIVQINEFVKFLYHFFIAYLFIFFYSFTWSVAVAKLS